MGRWARKKQFANLEKKRVQNNVSRRTYGNFIETDAQKILDEIKQFYEDFYKMNLEEETIQTVFRRPHNSLNAEQSSVFNRLLTEKECCAALKEMQTIKYHVPMI